MRTDISGNSLFLTYTAVVGVENTLGLIIRQTVYSETQITPLFLEMNLAYMYTTIRFRAMWASKVKRLAKKGGPTRSSFITNACKRSYLLIHWWIANKSFLFCWSSLCYSVIRESIIHCKSSFLDEYPAAHFPTRWDLTILILWIIYSNYIIWSKSVRVF
jgi:hypothetical protein